MPHVELFISDDPFMFASTDSGKIKASAFQMVDSLTPLLSLSILHSNTSSFN